MEEFRGIKAVSAKSRAEWRKWLSKNHNSEKAVWLIIYHKACKQKSIYYDEAVEEALCFGWIDSTAWNRDPESKYQYFTKRKPGSRWSKLNRERVEKLTKLGLMTVVGQLMVDLAKEKNLWEGRIESHEPEIPTDLLKLFNRNKKAFNYFREFSPSSKRIILEWIANARRPGTRIKRLEETVKLAARNVKANHWEKK